MEVRNILIGEKFGYCLLGSDFSIKYARKNLPDPDDDAEVVARLRRLENVLYGL